MSRKKQAGHHRPKAGQVKQGLLKRRLPLALPKKEPLLPVWPPSPIEAENPYVVQIVEHIQRVCAIASLPPFVVLEDWTGMLEAALQLYADNARTYAMTGQFIDDPPEVKEVYRRARERYLKATETYPAAYREMQVAFSQTFALLVAAAGLDLGWYATQAAFSPDVIGQVFLACLALGKDWWPYFPPWPAALEVARTAIPNGEELACQVLIQAHFTYRQVRPANFIQPEPGERFEQWFTEILPYCEPLIIGPALIDSGVMMLAAAAQFPPWAVKDGLIMFYPQSGNPQLDRLARINAMLHGLNGYELEMARAVQDIAAYQQQHPESLYLQPEPHVPAVELPQPDEEAILPPDTPPSLRPVDRVKPDEQTFEQLFRKIRRSA
ncbi:MAG: hypothetical protein DPW09_03045 [Anaerolineae bacterium]|nr:hypothetical protein [Anaerolineae bacterium]